MAAQHFASQAVLSSTELGSGEEQERWIFIDRLKKINTKTGEMAEGIMLWNNTQNTPNAYFAQLHISLVLILYINLSLRGCL
jgi:hypothetical protein